MICPDCKEILPGSLKCLRCHGGGRVCDVCGEATGESGVDICDECLELEAAETEEAFL